MKKKEYLINLLDKVVNVYKNVDFFANSYKFNELKKNKEFRGYLKGKRCFVLGNGPSLNRQDLSSLADEFVITVNLCSWNKQFPLLKTNVHFWADMNFFDENIIEDNENFIGAMKNVNNGKNRPICFYPIEGKNFVEKYHLNEILNIKYFYANKSFCEGYSSEIDFCEGIPGFSTVVDYGIILAIYMQASEIYLLGCDGTGAISYIKTLRGELEKEHAYNVTEVESRRMKRMFSKSNNEEFFNSLSLIFKQYRILNEYCKLRGIKLVNCTDGGILSELPRKKFELVLKE